MNRYLERMQPLIDSAASALEKRLEKISMNQPFIQHVVSSTRWNWLFAASELETKSTARVDPSIPPLDRDAFEEHLLRMGGVWVDDDLTPDATP